MSSLLGIDLGTSSVKVVVFALRQAMEKAEHPEISGIGFSGQMHGFVLIDAARRALSPAIIWADQRSADLLPEIESIVGPDLKKCGTAPAAGFLISTMYWLQRHQPDLLDRALTLLMPKDYIRLKITGELGTDESDASATGIFDVEQRSYADDLITRLRMPRSIFPGANESIE